MNSKQGILNLVLIGAKNSGKTVYLSSLWGKGLLSDTDSDTKEYLKSNWDYIESNHKAQATSGMLKILNFSYQDKQFGRVEFSIDDYDGKFTETISQDDENTRIQREKLKQSIKESEGCIFFIPFEEAPERLKEFSQEIDAFIQLAQFDSHNKSPIPASIVVTKWDESENFQDPEEKNKALDYIKSNEYLTRAIKLIKSHFKYTELIPLSSFKDHNLLDPINFSLENTFKQWFKKANELNETKDFEKLCKYLSIRWEDVKFNTKYDFKTLYENGQKKLYDFLNTELEKDLAIEDKINLISKYDGFFKTREDLFEKLKSKVEKEQKQHKRKKMIKTFSLGTVVAIASILVLLKITASIAEEEHKKIVIGYNKGQTYKELRKPIDDFLSKNNIGDFTLVFFDEKTARDTIIKIEIELQNEEKKIALEKWKNDAKLCLKSQCTVDENGKQISEELLSQSEKITQDDEVKSLKEKLISKQQYIALNLSLEGTTTFEKLLELVKKRDKYTLEESKIILKKVSKIKEINNDREFSYCTKSYDDSVIEKHGIVKILDEIDKKHTIYDEYQKLIETISDASIEQLHSLVNEKWSSFDEQERDTIKLKLKDRFNSLFKYVVISKIPADLFNETANESWRNNSYKSFTDKCNLKKFDFEYDYTKHEEFHKVDKRLKDIDIVENLRTNGINNISVSVQDLKDNSIGFGCGSNWGISKEEIIIEGFSSLLSYENEGASACNNDTRTFKSKITLKSGSYELSLTKYNLVKNYKLDSQNIQISIDKLYELYKGGSVSESIDEKKINLIFRK